MKITALCLLFTLVSFSGIAQNKDVIVGKWINSSAEAHLEIFKKADKYFGKLVWLKEPKDEKGSFKRDVNNPDASLRSKQILGLEILKDFTYDDGKWKDGKIYDPKSGKTYSCIMTIKDNGQLNMRGYVGFSMIGRSEIWKRVK